MVKFTRSGSAKWQGGLKDGKAADEMAWQTSWEAQKAFADGLITAGLSYDMQKCFDTIPTQLAMTLLNMRECDSRITSTLFVM